MVDVLTDLNHVCHNRVSVWQSEVRVLLAMHDDSLLGNTDLCAQSHIFEMGCLKAIITQ